ncbi:MAG: hypothetical protein WBX15_18160 [Thermoanaerobaculia bacterium]
MERETPFVVDSPCVASPESEAGEYTGWEDVIFELEEILDEIDLDE